MKKNCPSYVLFLKITKQLKCSKCVKYEKRKIYIKDIFTQNKENQFSIAERVEESLMKRRRKKIEAGLDSPLHLAPKHYWNKIDR